MNVLLLCPYSDYRSAGVSRTILDGGDQVVQTAERLSPEDARQYDFGVSYGYRYILRQSVLDACPFVNLHIAYLPWNRGAMPNLWSWIEDTPKGVSIHQMDAGIDTGPVYAQRLVPMSADETLASSYQKLNEAMVELFAENWRNIRNGRLIPLKQANRGTLHTTADAKRLVGILDQGWEVRTSSLQRMVQCQP